MKVITIFFSILIVFSAEIHAENSDLTPATVIKDCSTNERIYFKSTIKTDALSKQQKRDAIFSAVGSPRSDPNFAARTFNGQWFYEREADDVIFVGFKVRAHYLGVAIMYGGPDVETYVCSSENLKQSNRSIHKKAPLWKETLDTKLKIELGKAAMRLSQPTNPRENSDISILDALNKKGYLTPTEYSQIKSRILGK